MFYILSSFRLVTELCKTSIFVCFPFCSAGIQAVVTDQVFVLWWYMPGKFCDKIDCLEKFYIFTPVFIILGFIDDSTILFNIKYFLQGNRMPCDILAEIYPCCFACGRYFN